MKEWRFVDKSDWGEGEWQEEPDKIEWRDEATGLPCIARRGTSGAWCGYVAVAPGHKYHGANYDDVPVDVHGGLTYGDKCIEEVEHGICHVPQEGEPADVWWLGFDCAHAFDYTPGLMGTLRKVDPEGPWKDAPWEERSVYCPLEYVKGECQRLATQLANL